MATEVISGPIGEIRAASTAAGGTALTTTATTIGLPPGTRLVTITPRNFATAVVVKWAVNDYLHVLKTADSLRSNPTDYSSEAQDNSADTDVTLSSLNTLANGDALYVASNRQYRGVLVDVDAANGTSSILTVKYWDGSAWTDSSDTDGTTSGGATFAQDGSVTWSMPSDWARASLTEIGETSRPFAYSEKQYYWTRWEVSAQLDSSCTLNSFMPLNRSTAYAELTVGQPFQFSVKQGEDGKGCVEALTDAGTANLIVNVASRAGLQGGLS